MRRRGQWSLEYDPAGNNGNGLITFTLGGDKADDSRDAGPETRRRDFQPVRPAERHQVLR